MSRKSVEEQMAFYDPFDSAERLAGLEDFDLLDGELTEICFDNFALENAIIDKILTYGDRISRGYYELMPDTQLLYIGNEILRQRGFECEALRVFRRRLPPNQRIKFITLPFSLNYLQVATHNLRYITNPAMYAYLLMKEGDFIDLLLPFQRDLGEIINFYFTPEPLLIQAVKYNRLKITRFFLNDLKACPKIRTLTMDTVYHVMTTVASVEMLELLLDADADIFALNGKGENVLVCWAKNRVPCRLFQVLKDRIGDRVMLKLINEPSTALEYPITIALHLKRYHLLKFLLQSGANVNVIVHAGNTNSALEACVQTLSLLTIGRRQFIERPLLNWAAVNKDYLALRILLGNAKMMFTARNSFDEGALIDAISAQDLEAVKIIWECGRVDVKERLFPGDEDPLEMTARLHLDEIYEYLSKSQEEVTIDFNGEQFCEEK